MYPNIFICKLDTDGNFIWAKSIGEAAPSLGYDITIDNAGNIYTTGYFMGTVDFDPGPGEFNLTSGFSDIFVSILDTDGSFVSALAMGGFIGGMGEEIPFL